MKLSERSWTAGTETTSQPADNGSHTQIEMCPEEHTKLPLIHTTHTHTHLHCAVARADEVRSPLVGVELEPKALL